MKEFGSRFTRLGNIAQIRFGIKSGCDDFFMPRDVSSKFLKKFPTEKEWKEIPFRSDRCSRSDVETGRIKVVEAGDHSTHAIESEYLRAEIHSPMQLEKPIVRASDSDRVVLWTNKPLDELKRTFVSSYIRWGSRHTFSSKKSSAVPVPKRETCASREIWYDLTGLKPGIGFWTKAQKYRHIVPYNPERLSCNCNLYDMHPVGLAPWEERSLIPVLNSTLVAFIKHFFGRYAGAEGTLKTEVVDSLMMEIPSPVDISSELSQKLESALETISERDVTHLIEEEFRLCNDVGEMRVLEKTPIGLPLELQRPDRRELDLLVFELLGVDSPERRDSLVTQLYYETTKYYRALRVQDIQSSANRSQGGSRGASANSIAMGAWQQIDDDLKTPLAEWLKETFTNGKPVHLPDGDVRLPDASNMFENATLFVGRPNPTTISCNSRTEAELLEKIALAGLRGDVFVPVNESDTKKALVDLTARFEQADAEFTKLSKHYASDEKLQNQVKVLLHKWFVHGKFE